MDDDRHQGPHKPHRLDTRNVEVAYPTQVLENNVCSAHILGVAYEYLYNSATTTLAWNLLEVSEISILSRGHDRARIKRG